MSGRDTLADARCDTRLLALVEVLYAAATAEVSWDDVVTAILHAGRFDGVAIVDHDRNHGRSSALASAGLGRCRRTGRPLARPRVNPLVTDALLRSRPGAVWFDHEILASALWAHTEFRSDWMNAQGLAGWACVIVDSHADSTSYLEVYASGARSPLGHQALSLLGGLGPHLARAFRIAGGTQGVRDVPSPQPDTSTGDPPALPPGAELRRAFGLTRAEARLAMHLASGKSLARAATDFGVKMSTVRSQLGQIYSKTSTGRQCELVSRILRNDFSASGFPTSHNTLSAAGTSSTR